MKKSLLLISLLASYLSFSQTTLFYDDLETSGANWNLTGGSGTNQWIRNNAYTGFSIFIPNTPNQPGTITNSPNSYYLHIHNTVIGAIYSIYNTNFDTGSASDRRATMVSNVSTIGMTNVTLDFYYLCGGAAGVSYGFVEYSINDGATWLAASPNYAGVTSWTNTSLSMLEWDNQATLKFRYRWINGGSGIDPAFAIDEVLITATPTAVTNEITVLNVSETSWCFETEQALDVEYEAVGTYTGANVFTAQLSDATGSFATPLNIGSLTSTSSGTGTIACIIPDDVPTGSAYKIRVVASEPAVTGVVSTDDLIIYELPIIDAGTNVSVCEDSEITLSGSGGISYDWDNDVVNNVPFVINNTETYTVIGTDVNGCTNTDEITITINPLPLINAGNDQTVCEGAQITLSATGGVSYDWNNGVVNNIPFVINSTETYTVIGTDANGCVGTDNVTITALNCLGVDENALATVKIYPNPTNEGFYISNIEGIVEIHILNINGSLIKTFRAEEKYFNISEFPNGVYTIQIIYNDSIITNRIVKN